LFDIFQFVNRTDPLANRKSARAWAASLPANDPVGAVDRVASLVGGPMALQSDMDINRARAILELDRMTDPLARQLRAQYRLASLSEDVRERLWQVCDRGSRAFGHAYERVCSSLSEENPGDRVRSVLHAAFARLFFYVGLQARLGLFRYERWIPGRWRALHAAYADACRGGIIAEPFALHSDEPPLTPEHEYLQVLLLHRLNTGNLSPSQIDLAAEWLRAWVPLLGLAIRQPEGDGYWLDLGLGDGLLTHKPTEQIGDLLYLDVGPLMARLHEVESTLGAQIEAGGAASDVDAIAGQLDVARRLAVLWFPQAPPAERRGERHPQQRSATVALNWTEIGSALSVSALQRTNAPAGYYYDDYGRLRPQKPGVVMRSEARKPTGDLAVWQVVDSSESGYRMRVPAHAHALRIGTMLAMRLEDEVRWQLGIVRRLKRLNADVSEAGIEVISRNVSLIAPKSTARQDTGYTVDGIDIGLKAKSFSALYLPGQSRLRGGARPSIVLPPAEFTVGRALSLSVEGHPHDVVLAPPLERTKDWVWTPLELGGRH